MDRLAQDEEAGRLSRHESSIYIIGDARQAVALLARSAYLAEKTNSKITQQIITQAAEEIESDKYTDMIRFAAIQLQAAMAGVILLTRNQAVKKHDSVDIYPTFLNLASESCRRRSRPPQNSRNRSRSAPGAPSPRSHRLARPQPVPGWLDRGR